MSDPSVLEQVRQGFIDLIQDENWHVTNVEVCADPRYREWAAHYNNIYEIYVVELTAMKDINGPDKQGQYTKAPKGDKQLYTVAILRSGKLHQLEWSSPSPKATSSALTIEANADQEQWGMLYPKEREKE